MVKQLGDVVKFAGNWTRKDLFRIAGQAPKITSEAYLAYEFGWKPLVSDLGKMLDFVASTDKRVLELNRLKSGKGLRRNITVWDDLAEGGAFIHYIGPLYSNGTRIWLHQETERRIWVSIVWRPTSPPDGSTDADTLSLARQLVWGLNVSPASLWEAMPWSWLIDWFGSFGDYLEANRNRVPVHGHDICWMQESKSRFVFDGFYKNQYGASYTPSDGYSTIERLRQVVPAYPVPSFHLPFLSGRQWSILSSLAVLKIGK
jgi:hypothetical protein